MWGFGLSSLFWLIIQPIWTFPLHALSSGTNAAYAAYVVIGGTLIPFACMITAVRHLPAARLQHRKSRSQFLGVSRKDGSSDFELVSPPAFPLLLPPTIDQEFTVQFKPSSNGPLTASFQIDTDASRASSMVEATGTGSSQVSKVLIVVLVIVGAAIVVGSGIAIYEATK